MRNWVQGAPSQAGRSGKASPDMSDISDTANDLLSVLKKFLPEPRPKGRKATKTGTGKTDIEAKAAFVEALRRRGSYESVEITSKPADITAQRAGLIEYFEIKYTGKTDTYFGAATLTEWEAALANPDRFKFVVAWEQEGGFCFQEYTPEEFMHFSYIPPFKVYFNVPKQPTKTGETIKDSKSVRLTPDLIHQMSEIYSRFRSQK